MLGRVGHGRLETRKVRSPRSGVRGLRSITMASPHEYLPLINRELHGLDEFRLEILQVIIIKGEPSFQGSVRHPALALEQLYHLRQDLIKGAHRISSANKALASFRFAVSA